MYPDLDVIGCYIVDDNLMPNEDDVRLHNEIVKNVSSMLRAKVTIVHLSAADGKR